jgi:hypothetical protein
MNTSRSEHLRQPRSFEDGKAPHDTTSRAEVASFFCEENGHARAFSVWACEVPHAGHSMSCPRKYFMTEDVGTSSVNRSSPRVYAPVQVMRAARCGRGAARAREHWRPAGHNATFLRAECTAT